MADSEKLDEFDVRLLQQLEQDGRMPFSRIAEILNVSDHTVIRRYRRLRGDVGVRVVGVTGEARLGIDRWIMRLRCVPDGADSVAAALAGRSDTAYVALTAGGTEVVCGFQPKSRSDRDHLLLAQLRHTSRVVAVDAYSLLYSFLVVPSAG